MSSAEILCIGEVLWDALPAGLFLGGAPFNVACHLRATGLPVSMVSRVGDDRLGAEALRRVARYGVGTDLIQLDAALPTGFVQVAISATGVPSYEILAPAAWDAIAPEPALLARAAAARAIVFGSLAQRHATSRRTIERLCEGEALLAFDVNLRPPYDDRAVVRRSLERAAVVKVSRSELRELAAWYGLAGPPVDDAVSSPALRRPRRKTGAAPSSAPERATVAALAETFGCRLVVVTRGAEGAAMWHDGRWSEHPGYEVEVRDTVGTGDAFLAVLLAGLLAGADDAAMLQHAALMGAYVATQTGAVPPDQPASAGMPEPRLRTPVRG